MLAMQSNNASQPKLNPQEGAQIGPKEDPKVVQKRTQKWYKTIAQVYMKIHHHYHYNNY